MEFSRRLKLFLFGVLVGLIFVYFSLIRGRDRDLLGWLPKERVLQKLKENEMVFSERSLCLLDCNDISREEVSQILLTGEVNFGKSRAKETPCPVYALEGTVNNRELVILFASCDTITNLVSAIDLSKTLVCECGE